MVYLEFYIFIIISFREVLMEQTGAKPIINQAHIPRIMKHEVAQQLYNCECGKSYLTFAALYLHGKFKHNIKLSNKKNDANYKVKEDNGKTVYTYFLKQLSSTSPDNENNNNDLNIRESSRDEEPINYDVTNSEKVYEFIAHLSSQQAQLNHPFPTYKMIMLGFRDYLQEVEAVRTQESLENVPKDLALLFNEFLLYYIPVTKKGTALASFKKELLMKVLMHFGKWLKVMRYTMYTIVEASQEKNSKSELQK